ncbi:MAG: NAD(P)-binding domain-containing protein [Terriglobales bacterium]
MPDCNVAVIGAGPYGLAAAAYLRSCGIETRIFGKPMSFWAEQMPAGMFLRSNWGASHIAHPKQALTLDAFREADGHHFEKPIPLKNFVDYGLWYQKQAVPDVDLRQVENLEQHGNGFKVRLSDGEQFAAKRVVVAGGIGQFAHRPQEFSRLPKELASHTVDQSDLSLFKGKQVAIVGGGQSALESAALLKEAGADPEVLVRESSLNWVGLHAGLHRLGLFSKLLYSNRDVGPAGISRLVAAPHAFKRFPRKFQDKVAYRAIRPAGAGWLQPRLKDVKISLGCKISDAMEKGSRLHLKLAAGSDRMVDHCLLATGFRIDLSRYAFLPSTLLQRVQTVDGFPVVGRGFESTVKGLHFIGKTASWSFGPLLCFVSGTEFAGTELTRFVARAEGAVKRNG